MNILGVIFIGAIILFFLKSGYESRKLVEDERNELYFENLALQSEVETLHKLLKKTKSK